MDEAAVSAQFVEVFSERFHLYPQCWLKPPVAGKNLRIDFIGFDKHEQIQGPIGFEIKDPAGWEQQYNVFTKSLAQAMDYQACLIDTEFTHADHKPWYHQRLRYTFIHHVDPIWAYNERRSELNSSNAWFAGGGLRLAGCFGVGATCFDAKDGWVLTLATHAAFKLSSGPTPLLLKHNVSNRQGSAR